MREGEPRTDSYVLDKLVFKEDEINIEAFFYSIGIACGAPGGPGKMDHSSKSIEFCIYMFRAVGAHNALDTNLRKMDPDIEQNT